MTLTGELDALLTAAAAVAVLKTLRAP